MSLIVPFPPPFPVTVHPLAGDPVTYNNTAGYEIVALEDAGPDETPPQKMVLHLTDSTTVGVMLSDNWVQVGQG